MGPAGAAGTVAGEAGLDPLTLALFNPVSPFGMADSISRLGENLGLGSHYPQRDMWEKFKNSNIGEASLLGMAIAGTGSKRALRQAEMKDRVAALERGAPAAEKSHLERMIAEREDPLYKHIEATLNDGVKAPTHESIVRGMKRVKDTGVDLDAVLGVTQQRLDQAALQRRIIDDTPFTLENATPASRVPVRTHSMEVSTRIPKSDKALEHPIRQLITTGLASSLQGPNFEKNIQRMTDYPQFRNLKGLPTEQAAEGIIDHMVDNLLHLHDNVDSKYLHRSSLWYDGANKIVNDWSQQYGYSPAQVAGVLAIFSPQKDWYQNVDMGRRLLDFWPKKDQMTWDKSMTKGFRKVLAAKNAEDVKKQTKATADGKEFVKNTSLEDTWKRIRGKNFTDLETDQDRAVWFRLHDESLNPRAYRIVAPEGTFGDLMKNDPAKSGKNKGIASDKKVAWSSYNFIKNAMSVLDNDSLENISAKLGKQHKIRNFYNNMLVPNGDGGDPGSIDEGGSLLRRRSKGDRNEHVTMDTHAIAAALLSPLSGSSDEVLNNFGSAGSSSNALTGERGTYGINAEAYRRAAKLRGLSARQMQSITWEAVRGLFTDTFKRGKATAPLVAKIWEAYSDGKITLNEARTNIFRIAGGIDAPTWANTPPAGLGAGPDDAGNDASGDADDEAVLPARSVSRTLSPGRRRSRR